MKKAVIIIIFLIQTINLYAVPDSYEIEEILFLERLGRLMDSEGPFVFSTGFDFVKSYVGMHVLMLGRCYSEQFGRLTVTPAELLATTAYRSKPSF